jgi:hypothetical protein
MSPLPYDLKACSFNYSFYVQELKGNGDGNKFYKKFYTYWKNNITTTRRKQFAAHLLQLKNVRCALLYELGVQENAKFNAMVETFMKLEATIVNINPDKELRDLENSTFFELRKSQAEGNMQLLYSVDRVFSVLSELGWFKRLEFASKFDLRTVQPVSTSNASATQTPFSLPTENEQVEKPDSDEVEAEAQETELTYTSFETGFFPMKFQSIIAWACGFRTLKQSFKSFVLAYSRWKDRNENTGIFNVKPQNDIKVMSTVDPDRLSNPYPNPNLKNPNPNPS